MPTNVQSAKLGDGETQMTILGEIDIDTSYEGNPINIKAVVTEEAEGILLGIPGMENCGIDLISSKKELHFPNGAVLNYRTQAKTRAITTSQAKAITTSQANPTTAPKTKVTDPTTSPVHEHMA